MSSLFSHLVSRSGSALTQRTTLTFARTSTRAASTEAKESAANKGSELSQKAAQGWSQAVKAAGPAAQGAVQSLKKLGGPAGKVVSFVEAQIPPTVYYSKVAFELSKIVARSQRFAPPPVSTFQSYYSCIFNSLRQPQALVSSAKAIDPSAVLGSLRNVTAKQWATYGVATAEVIGFFTVGEIIGKRKLVGYHGETGHHH